MITPNKAVIKIRSLLAPRQSPESSFFNGVFWAIAGALIAQGLGLFAGVMTARLLGKVGYGEFGIINSTLDTFALWYYHFAYH